MYSICNYFQPYFRISQPFFKIFIFRAFWGHFRGQNWPKIEFFRSRHVCTHFFWISTLFPNLSNNFKIFDFWGAFGAILGGQNWPKIDFFRYRHVCTHFFGISTLFPNLSNKFYIFEFWGAFGAILGGQNWAEIDLEWPRGGGLRMRGLFFLHVCVWLSWK